MTRTRYPKLARLHRTGMVVSALFGLPTSQHRTLPTQVRDSFTRRRLLGRLTAASAFSAAALPGATAFASPVAAHAAEGYEPAAAAQGAAKRLYADCGPGGTADDTAAVQAALDAGATNVLFRSGATYTISAALQARSGQSIWAHGATIVKKHGAAKIPGILVVGEGVSDVRIYGGTWDGDRFNDTIPNPNYQYSYYAGIRLQGCQDVWLSDCVVRNNYSHGVFMGGQLAAFNVTARTHLRNVVAYGNMDGGFSCRPGCINIDFTGCIAKSNSSSGLQLIRSDKITITGGTFYLNGPDYSGEGDGIDTQGAWDVTINGAVCWGNQRVGIGLYETSEGGPGMGYTWKDDWSPATAYSANEVVSYLGTAFIARTKVPAGTPPVSFENSLPTVGDPYWVACPYDSGASQYDNGVQSANVKYTQNVKIVGCLANNNGIYATRGVYNPATTYSWTDSVYYNTTGSETGSLDVYACKVASSTGVAPTDTSNWSPITPRGGFSNSAGILVEGSTNVEVENCEANGNGSPRSGWGTGFTVTWTCNNVTFRGCTAAGNGLAQFSGGYPDAVDSGPVFIDGCTFDAGNNGTAVSLVRSATISGGTVKGGRIAILLQPNVANSGSAPTWLIDGAVIHDTADSWPAIQANGPAAGVNATVEIIRCRFPNSATTGNAYAELSGAGTTTSYIDYCGLGTTTRPTITTLNFTPGFSYPGSAAGPGNYALPGSSGVLGSDQPGRQTGSYTLLGSDNWVLFTITAAATATLPAATTCRPGKQYRVTNANESTADLTLTAAHGSVPATSIPAGSAMAVVSDGSNWQRAA